MNKMINELGWFLRTSYSYIHPRGATGHVAFILRLPRATFRYFRAITKEEGS